MTTQLNNQELRAAITEAIAPAIEALGNYLEEVTIQPVGKSRLITVVVDSDSHLNLDQVTANTRAVSDILDVLPVLGENPFTLEVTSPGIDRPLTLPRHWRKNQGRLVQATLFDGNVVAGRIGEVTEGSAGVGDATVNFTDIKKALLEIEFKSLHSERSDSEADSDEDGGI